MSSVNQTELNKPIDVASELSGLTYNINEIKHQIITRVLYQPDNRRQPIDLQLQNSVMVLTDEREKGDFISIMLDGTWGLRNGKIFSLDGYTVPDRVLLTWALIRDVEYQMLHQSFDEAYARVYNSYYNGKTNPYQYREALDDLDIRDSKETRRYLEGQQIPILRGLLFDMVVTQGLVEGLYHM